MRSLSYHTCLIPISLIPQCFYLLFLNAHPHHTFHAVFLYPATPSSSLHLSPHVACTCFSLALTTPQSYYLPHVYLFSITLFVAASLYPSSCHNINAVFLYPVTSSLFYKSIIFHYFYLFLLSPYHTTLHGAFLFPVTFSFSLHTLFLPASL